MIRRVLLIAGLLATAPALAAAPCPPLLDHEFERLQSGARESMCEYAGKVLLVVNTASYCGYTRQYEGLEELNRIYGGRGLAVLGFPSNDFGGQEPGGNGEIAEFCRTTYGVAFPMFAKSSVTGRGANPLFAELAQRSGEAPGWNFHKYLIDRRAGTVRSYASAVRPLDAGLRSDIEALLASDEAGR